MIQARTSIIATSAIVMAAWSSSISSAAIIYNTNVSPTKSNGDFISGTGIPSNGFAIDTDATTGVSVALKARSRDSGQPLSIVNDRYEVLPGLAADNTNPWWAVDLQFSPGDNGTIADGYQLSFNVDFDPTPNQQQYVSLAATIPTPPFISTANPGGGAWSSNNVDYVVSDSSHLGFSFWNLFPHQAYDPNAQGEYVVQLIAKNSVGATLATSQITVAVVPEPAAIGLIGLGALGLLARRRGRGS